MILIWLIIFSLNFFGKCMRLTFNDWKEINKDICPGNCIKLCNELTYHYILLETCPNMTYLLSFIGQKLAPLEKVY